MKKTAGAAGVIALVLSCNYSEIKTKDNAISNTPTIKDVAWLTQNLFQPRCASCHNGGRQPGGFKFESESDIIGAVSKNAIVVGNAEASTLYSVISSGRMPPNGSSPPAIEMEVFACWINSGAGVDSKVCVEKFGLAVTEVPPDGTPPGGSNPPGGGHHKSDDGDGGNDDEGTDDKGTDGSDEGSGDDSQDDGDEGGDVTPVPVAVTFAEISGPILNTQCTFCHSVDYAEDDVTLDSLESVVNPAAGPQLVQCGNADNSLLYKVLTSGRMPKYADPLSSGDIELVKKWISDGCKP